MTTRTNLTSLLLIFLFLRLMFLWYHITVFIIHIWFSMSLCVVTFYISMNVIQCFTGKLFSHGFLYKRLNFTFTKFSQKYKKRFWSLAISVENLFQTGYIIILFTEALLTEPRHVHWFPVNLSTLWINLF